ncbi:hypothetical protein TNCV_2616781 [Trichonephila clavipes]|nr:hypothetical protein TNCV_2616781 [Trichonephila clavipes]
MAHSIGSIPLLLKNFNLHEILNYSTKFSSATGNRSVAANVSKGLKFFDDKFVSISFTEPDFLVNDDFFIQGFFKAEMKKRMTYKPSVQIRTTCQVISATCTCTAGGTPAISTFESENWQPWYIGSITLQFVDTAFRCRLVLAFREAPFQLYGDKLCPLRYNGVSMETWRNIGDTVKFASFLVTTFDDLVYAYRNNWKDLTSWPTMEADFSRKL